MQPYENPFADDQELAERYAKGRASTGLDNTFVGALKGGVSSLRGTSISALSAGARVAGLDSVSDKLDRASAKIMAQSQGESFLTPSLQEVNGIQSFGRWAAGNVAQNIPLFGSLAAGQAAGGVLGAAAHGRTGLTKAINKAKTKELERILGKEYGESVSGIRVAEELINPANKKDFLKNAVEAGLSRGTLGARIGSDIGGIIPYATSSGGENYQAYLNDPDSTATDKEKAKLALKIGLFQAATGNYVLPMSVLERFKKAEKVAAHTKGYSTLSPTEKSKMLAKAAGKEWLHAGVNEGISEFLEDASQQWGGRQLNPNLDYNVAQGISSLAGGAVVGGAMASPAAVHAMHNARNVAMAKEEEAIRNSPEGVQQEIDAIDTNVPEEQKDFGFHMARTGLLLTKATMLVNQAANPAIKHNAEDIINSYKALQIAKNVKRPTDKVGQEHWIMAQAHISNMSSDLIASYKDILAQYATTQTNWSATEENEPSATPEQLFNLNSQEDIDNHVTGFLDKGRKDIADFKAGKLNLNFDPNSSWLQQDQAKYLASRIHSAYVTFAHDSFDRTDPVAAQALSANLLAARDALFARTGIEAVPFSPKERIEQIRLFTEIKDNSQDSEEVQSAYSRLEQLASENPDPVSSQIKLDESARLIHPDILPRSFFAEDYSETVGEQQNRVDEALAKMESILDKQGVNKNPLLQAQVERLRIKAEELELETGKVRPSISDEDLTLGRDTLKKLPEQTPEVVARIAHIDAELARRSNTSARDSAVDDFDQHDKDQSKLIKQQAAAARPVNLDPKSMLNVVIANEKGLNDFVYLGPKGDYERIRGRSGYRWRIASFPGTIDALTGKPAEDGIPPVPSVPIRFNSRELPWGKANEELLKKHLSGGTINYQELYKLVEEQYYETRPLISLEGHEPTPLIENYNEEDGSYSGLIHVPGTFEEQREDYTFHVSVTDDNKVLIHHVKGFDVELPLNLEDLLFVKKAKESFIMGSAEDINPNASKYKDEVISTEAIGARLAEASKNRRDAIAALKEGEEFDPNTKGTFVPVEEIFTLARHAYEFRKVRRSVGKIVVHMVAGEAQIKSAYFGDSELRANYIMDEYDVVPVTIKSEAGPEHMRVGVEAAVDFFYNQPQRGEPRRVLLGTMDNKMFFVTEEKRKQFLDDYNLNSVLENDISQ